VTALTTSSRLVMFATADGGLFFLGIPLSLNVSVTAGIDPRAGETVMEWRSLSGTGSIRTIEHAPDEQRWVAVATAAGGASLMDLRTGCVVKLSPRVRDLVPHCPCRSKAGARLTLASQ
jgi:hypothetical protein